MEAATRPYPSQIDCAWLASDAAGHLAMLVTGGEGPIPALALEVARPSVTDLEDLVDALEICSEVAFVVDVTNPDSFADLARRGVFVFDWTASLGAYELVARPKTPRSVGDLPPILTRAIMGLEVAGRFSDAAALDPRSCWRDLRL